MDKLGKKEGLHLPAGRGGRIHHPFRWNGRRDKVYSSGGGLLYNGHSGPPCEGCGGVPDGSWPGIWGRGKRNHLPLKVKKKGNPMERKEALINVETLDDGQVDIRINEEQYHFIMTSLSQAMCGAFDVAGEHEEEVFRTIRAMVEEDQRRRAEAEEKDPLPPMLLN